ncbi:MAG TPA: efflux RND transporter permease subunit [bacterium]|nr:efflux RND transporter permease subunit [bacterium]
MKLSQNAVKKPVTTIMIFTGLIIFGLLAFLELKLDILPEVEYPALTIITVYPGASAEDVEQQVTKNLEKQLSGIQKLKSIKSTSKENVSFVRLEFDFGTEIGDAANDVRDRIEMVKKNLPDYAEDPMIVKVNSSMMPVIIYGISAVENEPALKKIIDDRVESRLKQVDGVGSLLTLGAPIREIEVVVNPVKLKSYGVSTGMISNLLKIQNVSIPGGNIKTGGMDLAVRVPAEFESVEEIRNLPITAIDGSVIKLRDIAEVRDRIKEQDSTSRAQGKNTAVLMVQKQSGANTLEVARNVKAEMERIRNNVPSDVQITELVDSSELIEVSIQNLGESAVYAAIFVILVVLFFLREWKGSLIVILTIPFSMIIGLIFMYVCGYTINIFSLMALAITLGMVVDNTIVVFENITRHIDEGARPAEASIFGAGEMTSAISASTWTTVAVFLPLAFVSGVVGLLFKQLAFVASVTIVASLITSLTLAPMMSSLMLKRKNKIKKHGKLFAQSEKLFVFVEKKYESLLNFSVRHSVVIIVIVLAVFVFTVWTGKNTGTDYIPEFDMGDIIATVEMETGVSAERTNEIALKVEDIIKKNIKAEDVRTYYSVVGQTESGMLSLFGFNEGKNIANITVKIVNSDKRDYSAKDVASVIRRDVEKIPEIESFSMVAGSLLQGALLGMNKPLEIQVTGNDLEKIYETSNKIHDLLKEAPFLEDIESTVDKGKPEIRIKLDRERLATLGLNAGMAALTIRESLYGAKSGEFKQDNDEYNIVLRYGDENRKTPADLKNIMLTTATGQMIPLSAVSTIEESTGSMKILHETQQRIAYIRSGLNGVSLGEAVEKTKEILKSVDTDPDVYIEIGGQYKDQQSTFSDMYLLFALSLFLIYAIMASQFQNLRDPFIIMFTVPLSIIGVIWAFLLTGTTLSATTFIGIIMLLGIVVNNGIVLVDYTNLLRARGLKVTEAIAKAGSNRLRPVLMTAMTTIIGMVPMALNTGPGSEIWKPLGITVIGGLLVATVVTLVLIPCIYSVVYRKDAKKEVVEGGSLK